MALEGVSSGLTNTIAMMWFGYKIMPNTLKKPWKVVEEL
jgi:hypothetical protein